AAGSLDAQARIDSNDEIGALGQAFNVMTERLKSFINELEDRVFERTQELNQQNKALVYRSNQLNTVAAVARDVASAQELETLLSNVTHLISERFGFYHVGIFLLDERGEFAVLRAANSKGGQDMLARGHRLRVGQVGIVGYATGVGEARIATDVGQDAVYFDNPDLPATRSEMALPLRAVGRTIGALDVQSTESNAFTQDDIDLFSTLADQIAIAIQNNRLYAETKGALEEAQRTHRRYLQQEWTREIEEQQAHRAFRYSEAGLTVAEVTPAKQDNEAVQEVPINLRGETIGVIRVQGKVDQEEVETVRAVADQVALALENARLFEQTVRRADRERKVLEITSKIRSTTDPDRMLEVALEELQRALQVQRAQIILQPADPAGQEKPVAVPVDRSSPAANTARTTLTNEREV
ncbi:MAG TPA: GAF domain-containing protein, partial [Anaerolineaceae bacterium]|nr:GAF domain-containing protein [Anaerolineaceae bacterium]